MGCHFLAFDVAYWFVHSSLGCLRIVPVLGQSHLVPYFRGSESSLYPWGPGGCSSYEVHLRSYIVGFLLG